PESRAPMDGNASECPEALPGKRRPQGAGRLPVHWAEIIFLPTALLLGLLFCVPKEKDDFIAAFLGGGMVLGPLAVWLLKRLPHALFLCTSLLLFGLTFGALPGLWGVVEVDVSDGSP